MQNPRENRDSCENQTKFATGLFGETYRANAVFC
jgi:hypothetical protein